MKICMIGTGYVGLVSGVCFSELGNDVICIDNNEDKVIGLNEGVMPIYEPGLEEMCMRNKEEGRIEFTTDLKYGVENSDIIFIAVGTPSLPNGDCDLSYVQMVAKDIGKYMNGYKIVVNKSTVPVGTQKMVTHLIKESQTENYDFDVVSNPEFLREGTAIKDTMYTDRVVIGTDSEKVKKIMEELHKPFNAPVVIVNPETSEMIKYASNAFLATKISFINEVANICEKVGADVSKVADGMGFDNRIGRKFLNAGIGFGGACFPKDTKALVNIAGKVGCKMRTVDATIKVNEYQKKWAYRKLIETLPELKGKKIGVLGLAFKPNTDDMREAPSIEIINALVKDGCDVKAYDPISMNEAKKVIKDITYCDSAEEVIENIDALIITTEWDDFTRLDINEILRKMTGNVIVDGRNIFDYNYMMNVENVIYYCVGKPKISNVEKKILNFS